MQRRRLAAARMQIGLVRSSAYTRTDQKTSTRKISWTDLPRVYHNAQVYLAYTTMRRQIYVSGSRTCSGSNRRLLASSRILSLHRLRSRQLGTWKISWIDYASRENHAQAISVASYRHKNTENGAPRAELTTCTTLFTDRFQHLEVVLPNYTNSSVPKVQPRAQVISPGPVSKRVDSVWPPAESKLRH